MLFNYMTIVLTFCLTETHGNFDKQTYLKLHVNTLYLNPKYNLLIMPKFHDPYTLDNPGINLTLT